MEQHQHAFGELFAQLGLPSGEEDIRQFITEHSLAENIRLHDADFWSCTQAEFLREAWKADADWVPIIDQLNIALHGNASRARQTTNAR